MGQLLCAPSGKVSPNTLSGTVVVLWDTENLSGGGQKKGLSIGDLGVGLAQCSHEAAGGARGGSAQVIAVHGDRFPRALKSSLRVRGLTLLDAGPKRGSVDGALKGAWNDFVVDALLGGRRERGWLFVASGDKDFADDVRRAQRAGFKVGIICRENTATDFSSLGDAVVPWRAVVAAAERIFAENLQRGTVERVAAEESGGSPASFPVPAANGSRGHTPAPSTRARSPVACRDYQRDACFRANCRFLHTKVSDRETGGSSADAGGAGTASEEAALPRYENEQVGAPAQNT